LTAPRIAVVGSVMTDMIVRAPRVPDAGETIEGSSFQLGNGGKGANQAVMAASLGAEVEMVACVGDDAFGGAALENFADWRIRTDSVRQVPGVSTGVAPILVDDEGQNRIVIVTGANAEMEMDAVDTAFANMPAPNVVLCQLEIPTGCVGRGLEQGRRAGATTILNPAPFKPLPREILQLADWIVPNEVEFEALRADLLGGLPGDIEDDVRRLSDVLGAALAVTRGERGALIVSPDDDTPQAVPATQVKVLDTTGAGDSFAGAFAYALARGAAPALAARFACACASSSVERHGTQSSYPRGAELQQLKSMLDLEPLEASR
jgi:ribokinase